MLISETSTLPMGFFSAARSFVPGQTGSRVHTRTKANRTRINTTLKGLTTRTTRILHTLREVTPHLPRHSHLLNLHSSNRPPWCTLHDFLPLPRLRFRAPLEYHYPQFPPWVHMSGVHHFHTCLIRALRILAAAAITRRSRQKTDACCRNLKLCCNLQRCIINVGTIPLKK